ncbi:MULTISPECIES: hypothetical protein [Micromonospora]|uniref:Uncharacterized protein n=1 Tax=Micromonospora yangpuensis TaxID=683228 RepID=A0A1C6V1J6_9ACTN|nr:hypothetical protein [Micromonospora yangpuensis]SCL60176.1 hypothetical protein GA0070617_4304 [Micromonospora yangpuensis]
MVDRQWKFWSGWVFNRDPDDEELVLSKSVLVREAHARFIEIERLTRALDLDNPESLDRAKRTITSLYGALGVSLARKIDPEWSKWCVDPSPT